MRCYKYGILITVISFMILGCSKAETAFVRQVTPNPKGSVEERIAYHNLLIQKYKVAIDQESNQAHRSLTQHYMNEVRASNNRREQYIRKMDDHKKALEQLQQGLGH